MSNKLREFINNFSNSLKEQNYSFKKINFYELLFLKMLSWNDEERITFSIEKKSFLEKFNKVNFNKYKAILMIIFLKICINYDTNFANVSTAHDENDEIDKYQIYSIFNSENKNNNEAGNFVIYKKLSKKDKENILQHLKIDNPILNLDDDYSIEISSIKNLSVASINKRTEEIGNLTFSLFDFSEIEKNDD